MKNVLSLLLAASLLMASPFASATLADPSAARTAEATANIQTAQTLSFAIEVPLDVYFVLVNESGVVQLNLTDLPLGKYVLVSSSYGSQTDLTYITASTPGQTVLRVPSLKPTSLLSGVIGFDLPKVTNGYYLVLDGNDVVVTDISALPPGIYSVLRVETSGKISGAALRLQAAAGQVVTPRFEDAATYQPPSRAMLSSIKFDPQGLSTSPLAAPVPAPMPAAQPAATVPSGPKMCYVSGYTTKKGTVVAGYYRRC